MVSGVGVVSGRLDTAYRGRYLGGDSWPEMPARKRMRVLCMQQSNKRIWIPALITGLCGALLCFYVTANVVWYWFAWGSHGAHLGSYYLFWKYAPIRLVPYGIAGDAAFVLVPWVVVGLLGRYGRPWWMGWLAVWASILIVLPAELLWRHGYETVLRVGVLCLPSPLFALIGRRLRRQ